MKKLKSCGIMCHVMLRNEQKEILKVSKVRGSLTQSVGHRMRKCQS